MSNIGIKDDTKATVPYAGFTKNRFSMKVEIRPQSINDAKRFFEILSSPRFHYFPAKPKTIKEEKQFLRLNKEKQKLKSEFNFSIFFGKKHVGGIGVRIDPFRPHIGEIGFFVDEKYWNRGIASKALELLEDFIKSNLNLKRLEIRTAIENKASEKIAINAGYKREGILRHMLFVQNKWYDCYLYSSILHS
jgi:ribosomal-protein-alanine N-acetyltransferase